MSVRQLTLKEKWELDIESYKSGAKNLSATPICKKCQYLIKGDAFHCEMYKEVEKPADVVFIRKECPKFLAKELLNVEANSDKQQKLFGGIFGFVLGDAMGVPVEFSSRQERINDPVKEIRAYGTYHQPYGTWSDDTSLLLCLIQTIISGYSLDELSKLFIEYYKTGYLTPYGEVFDIGIATRVAIDKMINGVKPEDCGGNSEQDNGNGSLMRILPLAYYLRDIPPMKKREIIEEVSALTHGHKRAKLACIMYTEIAIYLIKGYSKEDAYKKAINFIEETCIEDYKDEFITYQRILSGDILKADVNDIKSSGYVVDTLEAAIWSFISSENYTEAILKAINLGGDTDTIAAVTGGLAGIFYGFSGIPNNWIQYLARKTEIYEMLIKFEEEI